MLPGLDGFELTAAIRKLDPDIPILFLSAKTLKEDRIKGLKLGADDYLVKPFSIEELLLKIRVFLNRSGKMQRRQEYRLGNLRFCMQDFTLQKKGKKIVLTGREAELLKYFIDNKETVLKREQILKAIWGDDDYFMGRSLDVFISRLRKYLASEGNISIQNLHGIGFKYSEIEGSEQT
jgi:DNA-binding response OmpR family regulator